MSDVKAVDCEFPEFIKSELSADQICSLDISETV